MDDQRYVLNSHARIMSVAWTLERAGETPEAAKKLATESVIQDIIAQFAADVGLSALEARLLAHYVLDEKPRLIADRIIKGEGT